MNNGTRDEWLAQIRQNPSDWQTMLIFADWLEESGDLLAAEQWRWIACISASSSRSPVSRHDVTRFISIWPDIPRVPHLWQEAEFAKQNNIRCDRYPRKLADVEAYLQASR